MLKNKILNLSEEETMKTFKSHQISNYKIPGFITKSSLIVLATVLVACAGQEEAAKKDSDTIQLNEPVLHVEVKEGFRREDIAIEEVIASAEKRKNAAQVARDKYEASSQIRVAEAEAVSDMPLMKHSAPAIAVKSAPVHHNYQGIQNSGFSVGVIQQGQVTDGNNYLPEGQDNYADVEENAIKRVSEDPVSTFSVDVDTGSYTNVRRMLNDGYLPPAESVRVEEFINYFNYDYQVPRSSKDPFSVTTELSQTPWNANSMLLKVGLKAYEVDASERPAANLVFLLDVSGSMNSADKLPLLKKSFHKLTKNLNADDSVSIVVYAGASGVVLEPTSGDNHRLILSALNRLRAGGSTNGAAGINLAYELAEEAFIKDGINRIILATDGDFNVGTNGVEALKRLVEDKRENGISLTTLGFGKGNYNDHLMEQIADIGNGNSSYIDSVQEAEKVLVTEMSSTLLTVAKDVKIQIEFNPAQVSEYRLIGYENRALKREDFNNDKVDAGEIGAGHTVTAIYEVFAKDSKSQNIDPLRYGKTLLRSSKNKELAHVKLRFKYPESDKSTLREFTVKTNDMRSFKDMSQDFKFATAVSAFGQKLKRTKYLGDYSFAQIADLADDNAGKDKFGYRSEFVGLVEMADALMQGDSDHLLSDSD